MKRALAMALGAMMVAGSAAPASAASQIDFSGYYRVYYMTETNLSKSNDNRTFVNGERDTMTDAYWAHRLNIDLVFRATDEISVYWRLRAPSFKRFGSSGYASNDGQGRTAMVTHHIYGQIDQDWGTLRIGQIDDGFDSYGLGSLGYAPSTDPSWTFVSPFDSGSRIDGVRYNNKWDNGFGLTAQYQKVDNNDAMNYAGRSTADLVTGVVTRDGSNRWSDQDYDRIIVEPTYEWDGGGAALGFRWDRNATLWNGVAGFDKMNAWYINPAIMHSWGDFSIHFEGMAGWATTDVAEKVRQLGLVKGQRDLDSDGYAFFLDADYNYGPGNVTLAGWWASGTELGKGYGPWDVDSRWDRTRYGKNNSLVSIDQGNFYPLLVAFNGTASGWGRESDNAVAMANNGFNFVLPGMNHGSFLNDPAFANQWVYDMLDGFGVFADGSNLGSNSARNMIRSYNNGSGSANHWAINLSGNHAFTDDISVHYALAYLALNEPNYRVLDSGRLVGNVVEGRFVDQDKDLGFEADLAFSFQLLDNLKFVTSFGYMFNGDAYKSLRGYNLNMADQSIKAVWDDPDDSYVWYNTLTFSF